MTPALIDFHSHPAAQGIIFKVPHMAYTAQQGFVPSYISNANNTFKLRDALWSREPLIANTCADETCPYAEPTVRNVHWL